MFAPLSPTSSRRLRRHRQNRSRSRSAIPPESADKAYDASNSDSPPPRHRRRKRRGTDPSTNRPNPHRRKRRHHSTRSPSPASDDSGDVEILPNRFDSEGRPLDRGGHDGQREMVEKIVLDFGDAVDGKKKWKDLLKDLVDASRDPRDSSRPRR